MRTDIPALAAEKVVLEALKFEQVDEFADVVFRHGSKARDEVAGNYSWRPGGASSSGFGKALQSAVFQHLRPGKQRAGIELARHFQRRIVAGRQLGRVQILMASDQVQM